MEDCERATIEAALHAPTEALIGLGEIYVDLPAKAAALTYRLAKSQACVDGNKRVTLLLVTEFLALNGADLDATNDEVVAIILRAAASDAANRDETTFALTEWFGQRLKPWTEEDG